MIAAHPDLVLWQVGTNSVLRDHPLKPHSVLLHEGIAELKAAGADVVLIDMQFAPRVIAKSETPGMEDQIALAAKEESVDLFRRFAVMRNWHEVQHIPFDGLRRAGRAAHERLGLCLRGETARSRRSPKRQPARPHRLPRPAADPPGRLAPPAGAVAHTTSNAASTSSMMSSGCSRPTETRTKPSLIPSSARCAGVRRW